MIDLAETDLQQYEKAKTGAYSYANPDSGYLRLSGETRVDFLQRQTTNDLRRLSLGHSVLTVLTSPTARIMDVMMLIDEGDAIGIVPLPGKKAATAAFLRSRIFFMDKVTLSDPSDECSVIELGGAGAEHVLQELGAPSDLEVGGARITAAVDGHLRIIRVAKLYPAKYLLVADKGAKTAIQDMFRQSHVVDLTESLHEMLRIEMGIGGPQTEFNEDYTPLEAGLRDAVADDKGCYTGQEIIARQLTYDKVVQRLVGLKLDAPAVPGDVLYSAARRVGVITSVTQSPTNGLIALGFVRRPDFDAGTILQTAPDGGISVKVVNLPFGEK